MELVFTKMKWSHDNQSQSVILAVVSRGLCVCVSLLSSLSGLARAGTHIPSQGV